MPRLKGRELARLREFAQDKGALAIVATLQPLGLKIGIFRTGNYGITFYELSQWKTLDPMEFLASTDPAFLRSAARFP